MTTPTPSTAARAAAQTPATPRSTNAPRGNDIYDLTRPPWPKAFLWISTLAIVLGLAAYGGLIWNGYRNVEDAAATVDVFAELIKRQPLRVASDDKDDATIKQRDLQNFRFLMQRMRIGDASKLKEEEPIDSNPYALIYAAWISHYNSAEDAEKLPTLTVIGKILCDSRPCEKGVEAANCKDQDICNTLKTESPKLLMRHVARTPCNFDVSKTCSQQFVDGGLAAAMPTATRMWFSHWRTKSTPSDDALIRKLREVTTNTVSAGDVGVPEKRLQKELLEKFLATLIGEVRSAKEVRHAEYGLVIVRGIEQCLIIILSLLALGLLIRRHLAIRKLVADAKNVSTYFAKGAKVVSPTFQSWLTKLAIATGTATAWLVFRTQQFQLVNPTQTLSELRECKELMGEAFDSHHQMIDWAIAAIPSIGFFGTVVGIMLALSDAGSISAAADAVERTQAITFVAGSLGLAFATTAVALVASTVLGLYLRRLEIREQNVLTQLESQLLSQLNINVASPTPTAPTSAPTSAPSPSGVAAGGSTPSPVRPTPSVGTSVAPPSQSGHGFGP